MQEQDDQIHIVYASDDRFAPIMGVSLAAVFMNLKDTDPIDITVFDGGISAESRQKTDEICLQYGRPNPQYWGTGYMKELLGDHIKTDRGSIMQYARLFVGRLPYKRALYLDCDVMMRASVKELWSMELGEMTAAAVPDVFSIAYRKGMELNPRDTIFNDGVMLIDLERWRKSKVEEKALAFIRRHNGNPLKNDLGVVNGVLSREILALDPEWNSMTVFYDYSYKDMLLYRKPYGYYSQEIVERAAQNPKAVHFTSSFCSNRPWEYGCRHPFRNEFLEVRERTPWVGEPLATPQKSLPNRLINCLPKRIQIRLAACLQAYVRPFYHVFMERVKGLGEKDSSCFRHYTCL